ncbi:MAG: glycosyltransferase family 2 protein [Spirochaetaceae bacterium]|jgi:glycosyltransferase involved in cell wall biosynthesis|nr:glycosyltransferase family 2 protein [Spirochaetaceae bacterium]
MNSQIYLSLVVPCYNEEESVPLFYKKVITHLFPPPPPVLGNLEIIFVDDGSKDNTLKIIKNLSEKDNRVHFVSFSRNFGKEAALLAGMTTAKGEYIATLDVDGQDPPSLIPEMLKVVSSGEYDCAGTRRVTRKGEPPVRSFFARRFYAIMKHITDIDIVDGARDFRLMNRKYLEAVLSLPERNRFSKGIFPWIGFRVKWFEYENIERKAGETKWSFWKLFWYSLDGIAAFSTKPLAISSLMGIILFLASLLGIIVVVIRKIVWNNSAFGWASMVCIILLCSGLQLFTSGILGQYLAKTYTEVKQRPYYIIKEAR